MNSNQPESLITGIHGHNRPFRHKALANEDSGPGRKQGAAVPSDAEPQRPKQDLLRAEQRLPALAAPRTPSVRLQLVGP